MNNESMRICCRRTTTIRQSSHCFPAWRIYIPWDQCYCPPPSRETFTTKDSGGGGLAAKVFGNRVIIIINLSSIYFAQRQHEETAENDIIHTHTH